MKNIILSICLLLLSALVHAQTPLLQPESGASPKHEVRAVWLTTIGGLDWPHGYAQSARSIVRQKEQLCSRLDELQRAGINTILLQTRIRATTIFPSTYEPWDGCLSGQPGKSPGYDALQFAIDECHKRGMELHAWVVAIPVGKWNALGCRRLRQRYPRLIRKIGDEGYMDPEQSMTADYLASFCAEIVRGYDVDGIHLDYIRYPETWKIKVSPQQGRDNITRIVRAVSHRVKALKPWVKMSCSPVGKYDDLPRYWSHGWNARSRVCQDAQAWLREGLMDELFPMMYFRDNNFYPFALNWAEESNGRIVVPGLGIYFLSPSERNWPLADISREMEVTRQLGVGHAYFRSRFLTDNTKGIYDFARRFDAHPSLVPPMTWENNNAPLQPSRLIISRAADKVDMLSWKPADADTSRIRYNVYSSRTYPVDTERGENLICARLQRTSLLIPRDSARFYAVCATDRFGNESAPLQQQGVRFSSVKPLRNAMDGYLRCDGRQLFLPQKSSVLDAEYITIENLCGRIVLTRLYNRSTINVSTLDEGVYIVRSLGCKGITHRIGQFQIKRSH